MMDVFFKLTSSIEKLKSETGFFKQLSLKSKIKDYKRTIMNTVNKSSYVNEDFFNLGFIVNYAKNKYPNEVFTQDGVDIKYFNENIPPICVITYTNGLFTIKITATKDSTIETAIHSQKAVQIKTFNSIDKTNGLYGFISEIFKYSIESILDAMTKGEYEDGKHVHGTGAGGEKVLNPASDSLS